MYQTNITLHKNKAKNTQKTITKKEIGTLPRVFLTPTAPKYTEITYKSVSDDPAITEVHLPIKLSAPYFSKISAIKAVDAPPDKGLISISGIISDGMPILSPIGDKKEDKAEAAPPFR